jgi:hypothetical protein
MSTSPPQTANKRAASPLSPTTANSSSKRVKEDHNDDDDNKGNGDKAEPSTGSAEDTSAPANGNGVKGEAGEIEAKEKGSDKMDEDRNEGWVMLFFSGSKGQQLTLLVPTAPHLHHPCLILPPHLPSNPTNLSKSACGA